MHLTTTRAICINAIDLLEDLGFDLLETKFMRKISPTIFELHVKAGNYQFFFSFRSGNSG